MKKSILNSPKLSEARKKKQKELKRRVWISISIIGLILIGLILISRIPKINIKNIEITGNKIVDTEVIESAVRSLIAGQYLWVIPKTNFLLYPKKKIITELGSQYKRLTDIEIGLDRWQTLEISVGERTGHYTWCGEELPEADIGLENIKCYFMDDMGYIFDQAPFFSGDVYLKFFGPRSDALGNRADTALDAAGTYFRPELFKDINRFKQGLEEIGLRPTALFSGEGSDLEFYLKSSKSIVNSPKIILRKDSDFTKMLENLDTAIHNEPLRSELKNKYESLMYIDLRFGNKVYYKFK